MLFLSQLALAQCADTPTRTTLELTMALSMAESTYGKADVEGFLEAVAEMQGLLPCISEQVPASLVARLHRTVGMHAFVGRDPERAGAAFRAARVLEPGYVFPAALLPPQHPMVTLYTDSVEAGEVEEVPRPAEGAVVFDGRRQRNRPVSRASLMQLLSAEDDLVGTWMLWPADPMPTYAVYVAPVASPEPDPTKKPKPDKVSKGTKVPKAGKKKGPNVPLLIGAGAAAALAGGAYTLAGVNHGAYGDAELAHKGALRGRTNALVVTGAGLGVVAVGLGVGAVVTGSW